MTPHCLPDASLHSVYIVNNCRKNRTRKAFAPACRELAMNSYGICWWFGESSR
ncbi:hypothetical protein HMPREF1587_00857 [Bifidobacterium breve JCP7499]|nr:hypothetical protein HMPREF1587_00857 [Bifidobacterium breve JCP7499]